MAIVVVGTRWSLDNPLPSFWDEGDYYSTSIRDYHAVVAPISIESKIVRLAKADVGEPPAHRLAGIYAFVAGPNLIAFRLISLAITLASAWIVFLATSRSCGNAPAAFATLTILLSPAVIASGIRYESEYPEFLAISGVMWSVLRGWPVRFDPKSAVVLAASIGLGLWSKPTFAAIVAPMLLVTLWAAKSVSRVTFSRMSKSITAGVAIGAIYLIPFSLEVIKYLDRSARATRAMIGGSRIHDVIVFIQIVGTTVFGPLGSMLAVVLIVALVSTLAGPKNAVIEKQPLFTALLGIAGFLPVVLLQLTSGDLDARYMSPAVFPASVAFAGGLSLARPRVIFNVITSTFAAFAIYFIFAPLSKSPIQQFRAFESSAIAGNHGDGPASAFPPTNQMNWNQLYAIVAATGIVDPSITYLGNDDAYNVHAISLPWTVRNEKVRPYLLWRFEMGSIAWPAIMQVANQSDFVFVAPDLNDLEADKQPLDNVHNRAFDERMRRDRRFRLVKTLLLGTVEPTPIDVFENRSIGQR